LRVRRRRHQLDVRGLEERHPVRLKPARHPHELGDQDAFANPQQVLTEPMVSTYGSIGS
jgi:hypothetical protein